VVNITSGDLAFDKRLSETLTTKQLEVQGLAENITTNTFNWSHHV
jgi:hypothetical protein